MNNFSKVAVCSRSFSQHPVLRAELLEVFPHVTFNEMGKSLEGQELIEFIKGHDKAIIALERIDAALLKALPELKVIGKYGVGLDKLDFKAMDEAEVKLGWTPGVNAQAVAELTLAMALIIVRNIQQSQSLVKDHEWRQVKGKQLSSMTYGILGCGHVGKALARLLKPFGCKIIATDIVSQTTFYREHGVEEVDFNTLISRSDVLSIHVPKNRSTTNIIGRDALVKMMKGSYLINTARGGLVDEKALLDCLESGHIAAAALDVFETEPPVDFSLVDHPKIYPTTHIGGSSEEAVLAMGRAAIKGLTEFQRAGLYEE